MGKCIAQWWLVLIFLPTFTSQAQPTILHFNEPPSESLGRYENLQQVRPFFTDRDGFLWFSSGKGIYRYDGHEVISLQSSPADQNTLSSSQTIDMIQDAGGIFWITTRDGGLNAYNPKTEKVTHFRHLPDDPHSLSTDRLRFLRSDELGQIWIGSDAGMNRFDPKTGQAVRFMPRPGEKGQLQGNPMSQIIVKPNYVYVSTTAGFETYNRSTGEWQCYPAPDKTGTPIPHFNVGLNTHNSICEDSKGLIWMGIPNQSGLRMFDPNTGQIVTFEKHTADGKPIPYPFMMFEDRLHRLWLCTDKAIFRVSADRTTVEECTALAIKNQETLTEFIGLYQDSQGLIWLECNDDKNPFFFDPRQDRYHKLKMPQTGDAKPRTNDILHDPDGMIWISTNMGLIRQDPVKNEANFVLKMKDIQSVLLLSVRHLLVISNEHGLFIFDKKTNRIIPVQSVQKGLHSINSPIHSVIDHDGDLWISTWGYGLFRIPKGSLSPETGIMNSCEQWKNDPENPNSLASNLLQKIAVDSRNNIWVCGAANGLCRVDKRRRQVQRFLLRQGDPDGIASNYTFSPLVDKQGDIWVTSGFNASLQRLSVRTGKFKKYGIADGFTNDYFAHAAIDKTGKVWLNQNYVVSSIDPLTQKVSTFPQFVGTAAYSSPIATKLETGEVYFSCQNNLRRFNPDQAQNELKKASPLRITEVSTFDSEGTKAMMPLPGNRWRNEDLILSHQENILKIKFALLDYRDISSRDYAYAFTAPKDKPQWINIGPNYTVDFAQLKSGNYLFHLKARNSDGIWTELKTPLRITVRPPWWLSPWAFAVYAFTLFLGFGFLLKFRLREQARGLALEEAVIIRQQRDEISRKNSQNELLLKEVHHRVKNNLGIVSGLLALQSAGITDPKVQEAIQASRNRVQSMSIIHQQLYQGEQLGAIEMADYFHKLSESILHSFGMTDRVSIECPMNKLVLEIDIAIAVGLITNELLTNSLKYAFEDRQSGTIQIMLMQLEDGSLRLVVADNGIGKPGVATARETGFGTQLINLLVRQLDGVLTYENHEGTRATLHFKRQTNPS